MGGWNYSRTLSLTSAIDGVVGQIHASVALPPAEETPYRTMAWPRGRSGRVRKESLNPLRVAIPTEPSGPQ